MNEFLEIGPAPTNECCAQIGHTPEFEQVNRLEVKLYRAALMAKYGLPPKGCELTVKANQHDFGTYRELVLEILAGAVHNKDVIEYADKVENGLNSWISAGFPQPFLHEHPQRADAFSRTFGDVVRSAIMITRPIGTDRFFPDENEVLHHNLRCAFPNLVPEDLEPEGLAYIVVKNTGVLGEQDLRRYPSTLAAQDWIARSFPPDQILKLAITIAFDGDGARVYPNLERSGL